MLRQAGEPFIDPLRVAENTTLLLLFTYFHLIQYLENETRLEQKQWLRVLCQDFFDSFCQPL